MSDLIVRQTYGIEISDNILSGTMVAGDIKEFYYTIETIDETEYNECTGGRFVIPPNTPDVDLSMGTVSAGKFLFIKSQADTQIKIIMGTGTPVLYTLFANKTNKIHLGFTGIQLSNTTADSVKGIYVVAGD